MKKLIVSCDGTWNTSENKDGDIPAPTNVVRLHNCLDVADERSQPQLKYYHPGVGTDGTTLQKIAGGAYGAGMSKNIMSAYRWLADNYAAGDEIYLFGFSRGAYTARSLAGFVGSCGLPDLKAAGASNAWSRIEECYEKTYRVPKANRPAITWPRLTDEDGNPGIRIRFVGVWDTVGSLGVPDDLALLNLFDNADKWMFHDTQLGDHIDLARHAVAIDEMRASFTPTLWTDDRDNVLNDGKRIAQLWFPGVHSDVGGGYASCGLSDLALQWMIEQAATAPRETQQKSDGTRQEKVGLKFRSGFLAQIAAQPRGLMHDSLSGAFKALHSRPRNRPRLVENSPHYHPAAWDRDANPPISQSPYHHATVGLQPGEASRPLDIYARNPWNETGIFLEEGATYEFTATGEWVDKTIACSPKGIVDRKFSLGEVAHLVGSAVGAVETLFRRVSGNTEADFIGSRRVEQQPWFALMGAIANDGPQPQPGNTKLNPHGDGSPYPHQTFLIGDRATLTVKPTEAGYLYAFANDAWHFYDNNRGSVTLVVKRIA